MLLPLPSHHRPQAVAAVSAFGAEVRDLVIQVSAVATGMTADDISKQLPQPKASSSTPASSSGGILPWLQLWATLASLYYADLGIKSVLTQYAIKFPSALVGMFGVFGLLCAVGDNTANKIISLYSPALNWIARWLPIFYVPALVTLPLALQGIPGRVGQQSQEQQQQLASAHCLSLDTLLHLLAASAIFACLPLERGCIQVAG